ncbi:hypothetical protein EKH83_09200 [Arcticibacter tournemirensis]|uniref:Uncharacterized protein n=1 Tax=Arcticibacter tournemirensis TaxID=699437 RepID=A0A4Q0MAW4_9SPHI|nr:hypothetical protein EKH83_09200 [Arcticibacter tournemirensis]
MFWLSAIACQQSDFNLQPSTQNIHFQLSTFNSQLTSYNSQPSTHNIQLETFNSQPSTLNLQLSTHKGTATGQFNPV